VPVVFCLYSCRSIGGDETAALHKLIGDLQDAFAQATRVMAAMANGLWTHTAPSETASSVSSVPDVVSTLLQAPAPDTWPLINPVVKVAVDAWIISVPGR